MATPQLPNPDVLIGCDINIAINGVVVGYGKNVEIEENLNQRPVEAIGFWKARGFKSVRWDGSLSAEFHILAEQEEGVVDINTSSPVAAARTYDFYFVQKSTQKRIGSALAHIDSRGFNVSNNDLSGQRVRFVLRDWEPLEGFN